MTPPEIATRRLSLAALLPDDAASLFRYRSRPDVSQYQSWAPRTLDEAAQFIERLQSLAFGTPGTWFQLAMRTREPDQMVGDVGIHFPPDDPHQLEIGVTVAPDHQRRGYACEAITGLLGYVFGSLRKHRVFASVDPRNRPSLALLKRIGMRQEAHFCQSLLINGEWVDDLVFAILKSEWDSRH